MIYFGMKKHKYPLSPDEIAQLVRDRNLGDNMDVLAKRYDRSLPSIRKYLDRANKTPSASQQFSAEWLETLSVDGLNRVAECIITEQERRGLV